jgi:hypothetical protein
VAATQSVPKQFVLKRLPATDDELWWAVRALWGYRIPRTKVCPNHVAPFTAMANAYFAREPISVWKASRGLGGKSRTLGVLGLTEVALLGIECNVLGGSGAQSLNVHAATQSAWGWHAAPRGLLDGDPTRYVTRLRNGGVLGTLMASQNSVRGPHPPRLRMDEIDEMDQGILDAALGQPMVQTNYLGMKIETQVVMSSTHQYPDKAMSTMIQRSKDEGWPVYEWCWRESANKVDGWLKDEEVERTKSIVPRHMWETEYELQEPSFANRLFDSDVIDAIFDPSIGEFDGQRPIQAMYEGDRPPHNHWVTAVDWAKERDQTIIGTFDTSEMPWVCVAFRKVNRLRWPVLMSMALKQWRYYGGKFVHDSTGVGDVVDDFLKDELSYIEKANVTAVTMSGGRARDSLFNEYVAAIENFEIKYPRIEYAWSEHRYVTIDDLFGRGHPPDSVVMGSLAWSVRKRGRLIGASPTGGTRSSSPWKL